PATTHRAADKRRRPLLARAGREAVFGRGADGADGGGPAPRECTVGSVWNVTEFVNRRFDARTQCSAHRFRAVKSARNCGCRNSGPLRNLTDTNGFSFL